MTFLGSLRPYQQEASDLIVKRERALLALDLGTGKTVVAIHAIERLREEGKVKCAVLIMSSSLTRQWQERIRQFAGESSTVIVVDGTLGPAKRTAVYQEIMKEPPAYLVLGIRQVVKDLDFVLALNPDLVLVDEVVSIKNFGTQQTKAVKKLKSRFRIGLTAEPIENGKAEELYSIMQWIDPSLFGNWQKFEADYIERNGYGMVTGYKNVDEMHSKLMTACINKRKNDPDVAEFMPTVREYNSYVEMDDETRVVYRAIARELLQALYSAGPRASVDIARAYGEQSDNSNDGSELGPITSRLLALQLLLDSPALLRASARSYNDPLDKRGSKYAAQLLEAGRLPSEDFLGGKLEAALEILEEILEEHPDHKVIVFARFKGVLPLLADRLPYETVQFHGGLNGQQRAEAIEKFAKSARVFLSSDAGGAGVDLYMASHLINYDLPLSSGMFKQRNGRHVRASSLFRDVTVDNLIVRGSIEEYQLARLQHKIKVADAIVSGRMSVGDGRVTNDVTSLTKFLEDYLGE